MLHGVVEVECGLARAAPIVDLARAMVPIVLSDGRARRRVCERHDDQRHGRCRATVAVYLGLRSRANTPR